MSIYKPGRPTKYNPATGKGIFPPAKPGEYRIRNGAGIIVYVGETNNLARRTKEHMCKGKLAATPGGTLEYKVADGRSSCRTRRLHERSKIAQHHPLLNGSKGGEGRIAKK